MESWREIRIRREDRSLGQARESRISFIFWLLVICLLPLMYHRITLELILSIISFILQLKDCKKGLSITFHVPCLSSLMLGRKRNYLVLWVRLANYSFIFLYLFWILVMSTSLSPSAAQVETHWCLFSMSTDIMRKIYSLSLYLHGHSSVNYFPLSIIFYKALNIMGCMPLVHCFPKSQLQTYGLSPQSCDTFTPRCLWLSGNLLRSYFWDVLEMIFLFFVFSNKDYIFVTFNISFAIVSFPLGHPDCTVLPFWNVTIFRRAKGYLVEQIYRELKLHIVVVFICYKCRIRGLSHIHFKDLVLLAVFSERRTIFF